jgi:hypothetical protein
VAPPTSRNYDAQIMLGSLASYAFEPMREHLDTALRFSPMGFRVWRAIAKLVKLNAESRHSEPLKSWVQELIGDSEELRWVAATLEQAIDERAAVCNRWPGVDEPWLQHVHEAANELDKSSLPAHLRPGAKSLFRHMILQNAGVHRRQAIETVMTSGWTEPFARALGSLLRKEQDEAWLRIRVQFALSFLQRRDRWVEDQLVRACQQAYRKLRLNETPRDVAPPRSHITEMHASLFAIGDCFGVEARAKSARYALRGILADLANLDGDRARILRRATRAAAYLLTFTAQPRENGERDLSEELLERLARHPDEVTAQLSQWALDFRFAPDGRIRPLLEAP